VFDRFLWLEVLTPKALNSKALGRRAAVQGFGRKTQGYAERVTQNLYGYAV
jgi:hypothetical protein